MMGHCNAILQIRSPALKECVRFEGVPLVDAMQVSILEDPGAPARLAPDIHRSLLSRIGASARTVTSVPCSGPQGRECKGYAEAGCRCLLVVVAGKTPIARSIKAEMLAWKRGGPGEDIVLPVLPGGADPAQVLGAGLDKTNVVFHLGHVEDTVDAVIQQTGLGGVQRRLFISYRRHDTRELADQLFDAFSRAGFEVFLDRFSGTPGRLFPDELGEEIVDKGVVLVLESGGLGKSPWTLAEVGFAFLFQIGLMALNVDRSPQLGLIGSQDRFHVNLGPGGGLSRLELKQVVRFVRAAYPRQMLGRRLFLEALLGAGLKRHGLTPKNTGGGIFEVVGGRTKYAIGLAERAPGLGDVRRVSARSQYDCHIVLGPHQFLSPERRRDLRWLLKTAKTRVMGEGEVTKKCAAIAAGSTNP